MECVAYGVGSPFVEELLEIVLRLGWDVRGGVCGEGLATGIRVSV